MHHPCPSLKKGGENQDYLIEGRMRIVSPPSFKEGLGVVRASECTTLASLEKRIG